jgi:hypothetical protein
LSPPLVEVTSFTQVPAAWPPPAAPLPHTSTAVAGGTEARLPDSTELSPLLKVSEPAVVLDSLTWSVSALPMTAAPLPPTDAGSAMGASATLPAAVAPSPLV